VESIEAVSDSSELDVDVLEIADEDSVSTDLDASESDEITIDSDAEDVSVIEFSSEVMLDEDSVLDLSSEELDDVQVVDGSTEDSSDSEFDESDSQLEAKSVAYSLVNDNETREVFVQEAHANLSQMAEELAKDEICFGSDKTLSIAIHTILGNARTLGMTDIAAAYLSAENLCQTKSENQTKVTDDEFALLNRLLEQSRKGFEQTTEEYPYYYWDLEAFNEIQQGLENASKIELDAKIIANNQGVNDSESSDTDTDEEFGLIDLDEESFDDVDELSEDTSDLVSLDGGDDEFIELELDADNELSDDLSAGEATADVVSLDDEDIVEAELDAEDALSDELTLNEDVADVSIVDEDDDDIIELEFGIDDDLSFEVEEDSVNESDVEPEQDSDTDRVAAVFESLDSIDDLVIDDNSDTLPELAGDDDLRA